MPKGLLDQSWSLAVKSKEVGLWNVLLKIDISDKSDVDDNL